MKRMVANLLASSLLASSVAADVAPFGTEIPVNVETQGDQLGASIAAAPDGTFAVVWTSEAQDGSFGGVYLRRFDADGSPPGGEQLVNTETAGDQADPDLAFLSDGSLVVVWDSDGQDGSLRGIYGQLFDSSGQPAGSEFQVNATSAGDQNDAVVAAAAGGGFLVAWETQAVDSEFEDLVARLFDSSGQPSSGEIDLNVVTDDDQEDLDLASDASGNFVAVWESQDQDGSGETVVARRLDTTGQPVGDEIVVNAFTTGDQHNPDVAVRADGSFVVAWGDDDQAPSPQAYFRAFAADGTPATGDVAVEASDFPRFLPRVDFGPNGGPVVVWISEGQDGSGAGSRIREFDAAGNPRGPSQELNAEVSGNQVFPHLATGGSSLGLAVWDSDGGQDGSGIGVYARRFWLPIFTDGFESGDTSAWSLAVP